MLRISRYITPCKHKPFRVQNGRFTSPLGCVSFIYFYALICIFIPIFHYLKGFLLILYFFVACLGLIGKVLSISICHLTESRERLRRRLRLACISLALNALRMIIHCVGIIYARINYTYSANIVSATSRRRVSI